MKEELQEKLFTKYPELFKQSSLTVYESCMGRGIETNDGWYNLLEQLCEELNQYKEHFEFAQIKEKFGTLTVYIDFIGDIHEDIRIKLYEIIDSYSKKSESICDMCGQKGILLSDRGWLKTRCEEHKQTRNW